MKLRNEHVFGESVAALITCYIKYVLQAVIVGHATDWTYTINFCKIEQSIQAVLCYMDAFATRSVFYSSVISMFPNENRFW